MEEGNEQLESTLLKCQGCLRSSSDAWRLQVTKDKKNKTKQKTLVLLLDGSFLLVPGGCLFTVKPNTYRWLVSHQKVCDSLCLSINLCVACLFLLYSWMCLYTGPAIPLHLPVIRVHWHCHHLHHHPPRGYCPAADAHSEVLLLGNQPAGVQRNHSQRSW